MSDNKNNTNKFNKVIGVGMHKTGLTSLHTAFKILKLRSIKGKRAYLDHISEEQSEEWLFNHNYKRLIKYIDPYQAIVDNPWNILYKEIDHSYPKCKFVLTIRDEDNWIKSMIEYFKIVPKTKMNTWIYNHICPEGNEELFKKRYRYQESQVRNYFSDRPTDLLVMNIENGDGWNKLCPFLDKPILQLPFPHMNENLISKSDLKI